jgi:hypothetical protein
MRGSLRSALLLSLSFGLVAVPGAVVIGATATPVAGAEIRVEPSGVDGQAGDEEPLASSRLPASDGTLVSGVPTGVTEDTLLMQGRFDTIPDGAHWMGIERTTLAPGAEWPRGERSTDGEGPWLYRVESGALTIHADGPITVRRAGATEPTPVASGIGVVLQRGDQGFTPSGVTSRWRNDGDVPTVVMDFGITTTKKRPSGERHRVLVSTTHASALLQPPVEAAVHRLTLAPGRRLPLRELPGLELVFVESGVLALESGNVQNPLSLTPGHAETISRRGLGGHGTGLPLRIMAGFTADALNPAQLVAVVAGEANGEPVGTGCPLGGPRVLTSSQGGCHGAR